MSNQGENDRDLRPRARALSTMMSLSLAAGLAHIAESYFLELLAWCAFEHRAPGVD
jgi:hypothetical protein